MTTLKSKSKTTTKAMPKAKAKSPDMHIPASVSKAIDAAGTAIIASHADYINHVLKLTAITSLDTLTPTIAYLMSDVSVWGTNPKLKRDRGIVRGLAYYYYKATPKQRARFPELIHESGLRLSLHALATKNIVTEAKLKAGKQAKLLDNRASIPVMHKPKAKVKATPPAEIDNIPSTPAAKAEAKQAAAAKKAVFTPPSAEEIARIAASKRTNSSKKNGKAVDKQPVSLAVLSNVLAIYNDTDCKLSPLAAKALEALAAEVGTDLN